MRCAGDGRWCNKQGSAKENIPKYLQLYLQRLAPLPFQIEMAKVLTSAGTAASTDFI